MYVHAYASSLVSSGMISISQLFSVTMVTVTVTVSLDSDNQFVGLYDDQGCSLESAQRDVQKRDSKVSV